MRAGAASAVLHHFPLQDFSVVENRLKTLNLTLLAAGKEVEPVKVLDFVHNLYSSYDSLCDELGVRFTKFLFQFLVFLKGL